MSTSKKKTFINLMCEIRDLEKKDVVDELSQASDMNNGIRCPVPGCLSKKVFKRWGDMRGHFLDESTHKRDYFRAFLEKMHEPFCDQSGPGFNHGLNSLMLALIRQPTPVEDLVVKEGSGSSKKSATKTLESMALTKPKKTRPMQEQQELLPSVPTPSEPPSELSMTLFEQVALEASQKRTGKGAFAQISEFIRDSEEINKTWRGKIWDDYVDMFHGIPPCFHCRSEEGKQIHHQNPLFHEIILLSLNKLGTTAETVIEERDRGNLEPLNKVLQEVFTYHMKPGKVCAVPYCQGCNQDAEAKRKRGKRLAE